MLTRRNPDKLLENRLSVPACSIKQAFRYNAKNMKWGHMSLCFMFCFTRYCILLIIANSPRKVYLLSRTFFCPMPGNACRMLLCSCSEKPQPRAMSSHRCGIGRKFPQNRPVPEEAVGRTSVLWPLPLQCPRPAAGGWIRAPSGRNRPSPAGPDPPSEQN